MQNQKITAKRINTANIVKISLLGVIGVLLMIFDFPLPIFPSFLQIDLGDVPALIGSFALGPLAGVGVEFVKCALYFILGQSSTGGVGDLSNFIVGSIFCFTAGYFYKNHKSKVNAFFSCIIATLAMSIIGSFSNYFIMIPFFSKIMPIDVIIKTGSVITPLIHDKLTLVLYGVLPFNIFKGLLLSIITLSIYKKISPILKKTY